MELLPKKLHLNGVVITKLLPKNIFLKIFKHII